METINIKINGKEIKAQPGQTILEVVRGQKLDDIPTLCHSDELKPYGSCFVCVVEVKGRPNLVPSCATRVMPDMEIETRNERILDSRKTAFELLMSNHYADCVSPCQIGCPAGVDAQGYIALAAMGQAKKAVELVRKFNPLPAVCGRICVRKCEDVCRRMDVDAPVGINWVKRYVTDQPGVYDDIPECEPDTGKTVGIVGSGPASLTVAWFLGLKGYKSVMYEAMDRSGGMLRYGIPTYRLPDDVLDLEVAHICRVGSEIKYGVRVGKDITLDQLKEQHDAVFIGAGAWIGKEMRVPGELETEGVVMGVDFLQEKADDPSKVDGVVVVVGGGNTAMDVARTSWRCGADKVIVLYRRTKNEMPADKMELEDCIDEGIEILELAAPIGIIKDGNTLKALKCIRMTLGEPDASGRRRPVPQEGSEFELPCTMAVSAIGQGPILDGLKNIGGEEIGVSKWETYDVDTKTMKTNVDGVFAGGDAADDGPTVVIDAIRDGQRAAKSIYAFLAGEEFPAEPFYVTKDFWGKPGRAELGEVPEMPRHEIHLIDVEDRKLSFDEVASGFEPEDTDHEAKRCLSCGCVRYEDCALRLYSEEYGVDMDEFAGYARKHKVDDRHPYIIYDPNKCVLCSRCVRTCARVLPIAALGMTGRGFRTEMRPAMNDPLVETSCVSCGNCVDACPTAALTVKYPFPGRASLATEEVESRCAFCSLGCKIKVKSFADGRYYVASTGEPGQYLCRFGRFGYELYLKRHRLLQPLVREGSAQTPVTFDDGNAKIAGALKAAIDKHGADAVAVFASPELTNEELYLAGRIAREGLGTNNIGSLAMLSTGREAGELDGSIGFTASTDDRSAIADADLVICNNTNVEMDHLVLAADIIDACEKGAKMFVVNSILDTADETLSSVNMDPMRGRASILWNGVIKSLFDGGCFSEADAKKLPGGEAFVSGLNQDLATVADLTGVDEKKISAAAEMIAQAKKVVVIHSPDRPRDQAPGDLQTLTNLLLLLRAKGTDAELLLPRRSGNLAGLEVVGADPAFTVGRVAASGLPGATNHAELQALLSEGKIRAAIIIGEDPMEHNQTGSYLQNVEFLAAVDWTPTETTRFADVVLPNTTPLECGGTRCNFEGKRIEFNAGMSAPSGKSGFEVLAGLAGALGVKTAATVAEATAELDKVMAAKLGDKKAFYWNTGEAYSWDGKGSLVACDVRGKASKMPPAVTHAGKYKREIREVGTERFRVH
jgi:formate dehydrogenase major subunit